MRVLRGVAHAISAISSVFGCQHERLTRPFTIQSQSYMVCLECGQKVFYSMDEMRRLSRREVRRLYTSPAFDASVLRIGPSRAAAATPTADDPTLAA